MSLVPPLYPSACSLLHKTQQLVQLRHRRRHIQRRCEHHVFPILHDMKEHAYATHQSRAEQAQGQHHLDEVRSEVTDLRLFVLGPSIAVRSPSTVLFVSIMITHFQYAHINTCIYHRLRRWERDVCSWTTPNDCQFSFTRLWSLSLLSR